MGGGRWGSWRTWGGRGNPHHPSRPIHVESWRHNLQTREVSSVITSIPREKRPALHRCVRANVEVRKLNLAMCLGLIGDVDDALQWINNAIDWGMCGTQYYENNRFLEPLRD